MEPNKDKSTDPELWEESCDKVIEEVSTNIKQILDDDDEVIEIN
jgi:hypothetical protein